MLNGKNVAVVLPAYNAEKTLRATIAEIPSCVDIRILVDDGSSDNTVDLARELGLEVHVHDRNDTVATSKRAIAPHCRGEPTSWSWCTPTISTLHCS